MLKLSGSLMSHSLRLKAINTMMCESRAAGVVLIDLPTKLGLLRHLCPAKGPTPQMGELSDAHPHGGFSCTQLR